MTRTLLLGAMPALLAALLAAPLAVAEAPAGGEPTPDGAGCDADACADQDGTLSRGPDDGACENCRPLEYGPEGCIDCSGPPVDEACLDGANATCDPQVQDLEGGEREVGLEANLVPGIAIAGLLAVAGVVALLGRR